MLKNLIDSSRTDKDTTHSYLDLYQNLLEPKKESAKNVLEIGIHQGGSIKLWKDFFSSAQVYGVDVMHIKTVWPVLINDSRIVLHTSTNAYKKDFVQKLRHLKFDFMLDDGPHTLQSMIDFIKLYLPLLADDGILIIEDVQSWEWIVKLYDAVPDNDKKYVKTYDLRSNKNRYDDIVFTIDRSTQL